MRRTGASRPSIAAAHADCRGRRYYADPGDKVDWPPEVHQYNEEFTRLLSNIKRRHDPVVTTIAQGILEYKRANKFKEIDRSIQIFLDRFYMSRIGIRVLIGQHIALNRLEPHPDYVGIICTKTNIHQIATEAIENATFVCEEHYGLFKAPPVQLVCPKHLCVPATPRPSLPLTLRVAHSRISRRICEPRLRSRCATRSPRTPQEPHAL